MTGTDKASQAEAILAHLECFGSIDPATALSAYGCFRLAARVNELRAAGHAIRTNMVRSREGKRYAQYEYQQ